jgi:two-component system, OmpR family, phosphate regulon sensor histidine kinase PhoR
MISSLLLLVVLQFFWLKNSYETAFFDFRRETTMLFRNTVFNLRDSLFVKNIEPAWDDSASINKTIVGKIPRRDSIRIRMLRTDTLIDHLKTKDGSSRVEVFVSSSGRTDSDATFLKPLASAVHRMQGHQRSFFIRVGPDTLNIDTLSSQFARTLAQSGINASFKISRDDIPGMLGPTRRMIRGEHDDQEEDDKTKVYQDTLSTDRIPLNPMHAYWASFPAIRSIVLRAIAPQMAFAGFLTFIIVASFIVMYRNIKAQEKLMELKNDFINNVTHELKTPVATVSVALEALKDFNGLSNPERTKEYLDIAQNELNRLTLMTDKILKASAFENQGLSFVPEPVDIQSIIEQVMSSMKLVFEKKKLKVNYSSEGNNFEVYGSEVHLTNVVYNLVDNALKYSPENSSIDIRLKNSTERLHLTVCDYGIGIPKEYHKKIFEKFFRVPTGDVHNVKGYGLGLNYVASVIRNHHGSIDVDSELGKGSSFIITLPRRHG